MILISPFKLIERINRFKGCCLGLRERHEFAVHHGWCDKREAFLINFDCILHMANRTAHKANSLPQAIGIGLIVLLGLSIPRTMARGSELRKSPIVEAFVIVRGQDSEWYGNTLFETDIEPLLSARHLSRFTFWRRRPLVFQKLVKPDRHLRHLIDVSKVTAT
jgi:hypothetical protein